MSRRADPMAVPNAVPPDPESARLASDSRIAIAPPPTNPDAYLETNVLVANSAACRSASTILPASAMPLPAISKAVP